ncbi:MAG: SAM-dependent chlorinase/fluorinase [Thermodesulfobacteriota bacterium]
MPIITLTTDFGLRDNFVGVMKGVILGLNPQAAIVDLGHEVPAHDPAAAAFLVHTARPYFPEGTIHVVVVDPGVGSDRALLAARAFGQVFLAPDNGVLSYVLEAAPSSVIRELTNTALRLPEISRTFHGRDILAPAAAHLSLGVPFEDLGPETRDFMRLPSLEAHLDQDRIVGQVVYVDRFGNLVTNIPARQVEARAGRGLTITAAHIFLVGLAEAYSDVKPGQWVAVAGSSGFIEIARYLRRADTPPTLTLGTQVILEFQR